MCKYKLSVVLCGCQDPSCKLRTVELQEHNLNSPGHVISINKYFRVSSLCLGWFVNNDPNRLVVKWGLRENQSNSKIDCTNRELRYLTELQRVQAVCRDCLKHCIQNDMVDPNTGFYYSEFEGGRESPHSEQDDDNQVVKENDKKNPYQQ